MTGLKVVHLVRGRAKLRSAHSQSIEGGVHLHLLGAKMITSSGLHRSARAYPNYVPGSAPKSEYAFVRVDLMGADPPEAGRAIPHRELPSRGG
jgi:hypothetical protein